MTTWPAQSPDLQLQTRVNFINTREELMAEIRVIWENVPQNEIEELYNSIPIRITEVIKMKGDLTNKVFHQFMITKNG